MHANLFIYFSFSVHPCDQASKGGCHQQCEKNGDEAKCGCNEGYEMTDDGKTCKESKGYLLL